LRASLVLAAFLVVGLSTACGSAHRQQLSSGSIVFTTDLVGSEAVYAVNPAGSGLRRLFSVPGTGGQVLWNSHGTKALVLPGGGTGPLAYLLDWPSGKRSLLRVDGLDPFAISEWSPDGEKLLLTTDRGLVVYDVARRRAQRIDASQDDHLAWSGDSMTVLHMNGSDDVISGAPITGAHSVPLAHVHQSDAGFPGESADGKWLSFVGPNSAELFVLRRSGGRPRRVGHSGVNNVAASWSPSGARLVFANATGVTVLDPASGRRVVVKDPGLDPLNETPSWSPDGEWVLYWRKDLGYGAPASSHLQLWAMRPDGTGAHALTQGLTPNDGFHAVTWVSATVHGRPLPRPVLFSPPRGRTITTPLPVVALGSSGDHAAVATGFGSEGGAPPEPLGPIVSVRAGAKTAELAVRGCRAVDDIFVMQTGTIGYVCNNNSVGYGFDYAVRLGPSNLVHTVGGEFAGAYLSGVAADGHTLAFGVEHTRADSQVTAHSQIRETRIYYARGPRRKLAATLRGSAGVASVEGALIAVLRGQSIVDIVSLGGRVQTLKFGGLDGVAFDGPRLVVLEDGRVLVIGLKSGRRSRSWRTAQPLAADVGSGSASKLEDVQGGLLAYVVDTYVHVLDLSNGREVVLNTPGATGPLHASFGSGGLFYSYNEAYAKRPGRLGFITADALTHAISAKGAAVP